MNLYLLVFLLLAAGAVWEWFKPEYGEKIYWVCWGAATVCLCLRFGQGTDYVTYHAIYETIPPVIDFSQGYICGYFPEVGWRLLCALFKLFHAPFWVFTAVLGLAEMLLLHRFLQKYVPVKTAGLFMSYPVLYMVYMVSGLRQGLAICLFLGVLIPFYLEKKWIPYILGVLIAASFHRVGYAWLILPVVYYIPINVMFGLAGLAAVGGALLQIGIVEQTLVTLVPMYHVQQFLLEGDISLFALGERVFCFGILAILYIWNQKKDRNNSHETELLLKAYMCGVCFYLLMLGNSYYASRYGIIFKVLESAVVVTLIVSQKKMKNVIIGFFFSLTIVMGIKNMNAMIVEGGYTGVGISVWNFPYISVLRQEDIEEYRPYEQLLWERYNDNIEDQQLWLIE